MIVVASAAISIVTWYQLAIVIVAILSNTPYKSFEEEDVAPSGDDHSCSAPCRNLSGTGLSNTVSEPKMGRIRVVTYESPAASSPPKELASELEAMKMLMRKKSSVFL
jgi:hypothetical protein